MTAFLIKSTLTLFVLLAIYHLALEREKMHQFNRFYLLFSLAFSFVIPFITIEVIGEAIAPIQQNYTYVDVAQENIKVTEIKETIDYKPIILWSLYALVTLILLFRYIRNILKIATNIKSNPIIEYKNAKLVLLEEQIPPHTFLNYIFLNKTDYENSKIEEELYTHELIHVTQKHTLDVLFIETLKTVFWFNPLFIFYKKAIQLNHEFLADEKVVNTYNDIPFYQNLLLAHANTNPTFALTSNSNYSITKKRFIMMTKTVSKTKVLLCKIALLPLLSGLIFFTCIESAAQIATTTNPNKKDDKIAFNAFNTTPSPTESPVKNEKQAAEENEFVIDYLYSLKGTKINETTLKNSLAKLSNYVVSTYKSSNGVDKKDEVIIIRFLLKRGGNLTEVKSYDNRGTEPEVKLVSILKATPKSIFENNYGEADWNEILVQMMFKPKGIEELIAKEKGFTGKVAVGFPGLE